MGGVGRFGTLMSTIGDTGRDPLKLKMIDKISKGNGGSKVPYGPGGSLRQERVLTVKNKTC